MESSSSVLYVDVTAREEQAPGQHYTEVHDPRRDYVNLKREGVEGRGGGVRGEGGVRGAEIGEVQQV